MAALPRLALVTLPVAVAFGADRKSTRLNSSHTEIYTLSLHDALPICRGGQPALRLQAAVSSDGGVTAARPRHASGRRRVRRRSEEHTSELQSHRDLHSFPTRRSSDLSGRATSSTPSSRSELGWRRYRGSPSSRFRSPSRSA